MSKTIPNPEILEKNIDAKTRDFVKSHASTIIESNGKEIIKLRAEIEGLHNKIKNLEDTIPTIFKGLVDQPVSDFKKQVTKGDVIRFMKKMGWSE